jgi:hypothetical protein
MYERRLRTTMLSMLLLISQPLAAVYDEDAKRAGRKTRLPLREIPQHAALLGRVRGRRVERAARRAAPAA